MSNNADGFLVFPVREGAKVDHNHSTSGRICPNCKMSNSWENAFCENCGMDLRIATQYPDSEQAQYNNQQEAVTSEKICSNCRMPNQVQNNFCENCGMKL